MIRNVQDCSSFYLKHCKSGINIKGVKFKVWRCNLKLSVLASSSSGNSIYIEHNNFRCLVDAGLTGKKVVENLAQIERDIKDINAIFVTHEHIDHIKGSRGTRKKVQYSCICQRPYLAKICRNVVRSTQILNFILKKKKVKFLMM